MKESKWKELKAYIYVISRKETTSSTNFRSYWLVSLATQKETRDAERNLTGLLLLLSEEQSNWHAFMITTVSHQGYICFLLHTADIYNQFLFLSISWTEVAIRSHEAGP